MGPPIRHRSSRKDGLPGRGVTATAHGITAEDETRLHGKIFFSLRSK
jgi:hypothetical protein